jgi:aspartate/methionine/tyrosine aminotransferase
MRDEFSMRRDYMFDRITKIPNITALKPEGAFLHFGKLHRFVSRAPVPAAL